MQKKMGERVAAAGIAAVAWAGLAVQCAVVYRQNGSLLLTLWIVLAFFTITTNGLVAIVFTGVALGRTRFGSSGVVAGTMLAILLVGVVYGLLLHGMTELSGGSAVANGLLHMVTPVAVPLFWLAFVDKGELRWRDPLVWAVYPLGYLGYALARGTATGRYAYPFLNGTMLGWWRVGWNAGAIAAGFMACGALVVWLDRRGRERDGR